MQMIQGVMQGIDLVEVSPFEGHDASDGLPLHGR